MDMQAAQFQHNVPVAIWSLWCQLLRCHLAQNKASVTHQLLLLAMPSHAPESACLVTCVWACQRDDGDAQTKTREFNGPTYTSQLP